MLKHRRALERRWVDLGDKEPEGEARRLGSAGQMGTG